MKIVAATLALALALPTITSAGDGRYQMVPYQITTSLPSLAFLDTKEGRWKVCSHQQMGPDKDVVICGEWKTLSGNWNGLEE